MLQLFDRYRKAIITGGGVFVFLLAGVLTMLLTSSRNEPAPSVSNSNSQKSQQENREIKNESPVSGLDQPAKILYVYITGEIKKPGVYKLSEDARIFQLIEKAGGFTSKADQESLNLAESLSDGLHIHVGAKIPQSTQTQARIPGVPVQAVQYVQTVPSSTLISRQQSTSNSASKAEKVDINHADIQELEKLKGVGPAIAKRIIDYRNAHGRFTKPEDLINVRGIGPKTLEKMKDQIVIR